MELLNYIFIHFGFIGLGLATLRNTAEDNSIVRMTLVGKIVVYAVEIVKLFR
jgi:hypothetical protein